MLLITNATYVCCIFNSSSLAYNKSNKITMSVIKYTLTCAIYIYTVLLHMNNLEECTHHFEVELGYSRSNKDKLNLSADFFPTIKKK